MPSTTIAGAAMTVTSTVVEVWLSLGDSEMAGSGSNTSGLPDFYPPSDGSTLMVHTIDGTSVVALSEPDGVGPDGMFCWFRSRQTGRRICIVRAAVSATRSTYYAVSAVAGSPYQKVLTAVSIALAETGAIFAGFLLYGGANDGSLASPDWATNWSGVFAGLKADIAGAINAPILYAQLPSGTPHLNYSTSWDTVRSQQSGWQSVDRRMVQVDPAGPWAGTPQNNSNANYLVHQTTEAALTLARQFAEALGAVPVLPVVDPNQISDLVFDTHNIVTSGGAVDALSNDLSSRSFAGSGTSRPTYSSADSSWLNAPSATWDGVNDQLDYSGPLSELAALHNGAGGTLSILCRYTAANSDIFSTRASGTAPGILLRLTGGAMNSFVYPASGFTAYATSMPSTVVPINTPVVLQFRLKVGEQSQRKNGQAWQTAVTFNAVSLSPLDPEFAKLGHQFYRFAGQIQRVVFHNRYLTNHEADEVSRFLMVFLGA